jgi:preprotein translocase subunit Sec61beta
MSEEEQLQTTPKAPKEKGADEKAQKQAAHMQRIKRTLVACFMGIAMGLLSFYVSGQVDPATGLQPNAIIGVLFLMAGVVFQKHIFMMMRIDYTELGGKDWFYQSFMTFAFWFISWSTMLTTALM